MVVRIKVMTFKVEKIHCESAIDPPMRLHYLLTVSCSEQPSWFYEKDMYFSKEESVISK